MTPTGAGSFAVLGSHDYTDEGSFAVSVTITGPSHSTTVGAGATLLEELLPDGTRGTPNERFISEVYRDLLGRPVDAGGLATWSGLLDQGVSRLQVVTLIEHDPGHTNSLGSEVTAACKAILLHRDPDPGGFKQASSTSWRPAARWSRWTPSWQARRSTCNSTRGKRTTVS